MTYYSTGTVTVANGGTTVTGVGTGWAGKIKAGDLFSDPAQGLVARVTADAVSDTSLSINPWPGSSLAADPYEVLFTSDVTRMQQTTRQLLDALDSAANVGFDPPVGMTADDVQAAIEELFGDIDGAAPQATTYTKTETDGLVATAAAGVASRGTVRVATTASITIATALNNGDTLDGVALATGDLVLVKNQAAPAENGVYVVGVTPARTAQFDSYDEHPGSLVVVQEGTANADTFWYCTSNKGGTLGSTAIAFAAMTLSSTPADDSVTNAKLANMATATIKGRTTAGTGDPEDLSASQVRTVLGLAAGDSPQLAGIELGHAADTTLTRSAAGRLAVEGVNVALESGQLQFPATQNPSADPNNLDDYEENTWTPGLTFGGGSTGMTFSLRSGSYTKIGNRVFFEGRITLTAKGSSTGAAKITGLPFTAGNYGACTISYYANLASISGVPLGYVDSGAATIQLQNGGAASAGTITEGNFNNTSDVLFFGNYRV